MEGAGPGFGPILACFGGPWPGFRPIWPACGVQGLNLGHFWPNSGSNAWIRAIFGLFRGSGPEFGPFRVIFGVGSRMNIGHFWPV